MPDSPNDRRVGIRIRTFEACSGFTFVSAHGIAQQPKAAFVAGLRPSQLPSRAACQLPDQSTFIRVRPSLTLVGPRGAHGHSRRFNRPPLAWGCTSSRLVKGKADRRQVQLVVYSNCPMHSLRRSGSTNVSQSNHTPDFVSADVIRLAALGPASITQSPLLAGCSFHKRMCHRIAMKRL